MPPHLQRRQLLERRHAGVAVQAARLQHLVQLRLQRRQRHVLCDAASDYSCCAASRRPDLSMHTGRGNDWVRWADRVDCLPPLPVSLSR